MSRPNRVAGAAGMAFYRLMDLHQLAVQYTSPRLPPSGRLCRQLSSVYPASLYRRPAWAGLLSPQWRTRAPRECLHVIHNLSAPGEGREARERIYNCRNS